MARPVGGWHSPKFKQPHSKCTANSLRVGRFAARSVAHGWHNGVHSVPRGRDRASIVVFGRKSWSGRWLFVSMADDGTTSSPPSPGEAFGPQNHPPSPSLLLTPLPIPGANSASSVRGLATVASIAGSHAALGDGAADDVHNVGGGGVVVGALRFDVDHARSEAGEHQHNQAGTTTADAGARDSDIHAVSVSTAPPTTTTSVAAENTVLRKRNAELQTQVCGWAWQCRVAGGGA